METSREEMCKSVTDWFIVFYNENCISQDQHEKHYLNDLTDGVAVAVALQKLAGDYFTDSWFSKLKINVGHNWRLKASNLKKIMETVTEYYNEVLNITLNEFICPNVMKIAEKGDICELGRLLQLILGCAINCSSKMEYIRQIMELEVSLQRNIMQAIQELESSYQGTMASKASSISNFDTKSIQEDRDRLAQKCHEAERQIALLHEEKSLLQQELNKLQREVEGYGSPKGTTIGDDGTSLGPMLPGSNRHNDLRRQIDALKEELLQTEAQRDDFKIKSMQLEEDLVILRLKLDESSQAQSELSQLKDELDALREANDKLKVSEALISTYKKKLEDYSDLKRQVKQLEERNADLTEQTLHKEENVKKLSALKGEVELYKKEIQELHTRLDTEINKCVKIEFELTNSNAKLTALQREHENLVVERDTLLEQCDQMRCAEGMTTPVDGARNAISNELTLPAQREKIRLLEEENKALREGQGGQTALAQMLEDANQRSEKLREQLRVANQKILTLTAQTSSDGSESGKSGSGQLKESLENNEQKGLQNENGRLQSKCSQLEAALNAREQEIILLEAKYRKCVEKAKDVIKCYEPRLITDSPQMTDKNADSENELLVASSHSQPIMSPLEERLMATAFHNLAVSCQRDVVDARLALINGGGQSFLSRQRQPPTRKTSLNKRSK